MAKKVVSQVTCDRCNKTDIQPVTATEDTVGEESTGEFSITFHGKTHTYPDLCRGCRGALEALYERAGPLERAAKKPKLVASKKPKVAVKKDAKAATG
jgi:hypothetical protein